MKNIDDLLREREENDSFDESLSEQHWTNLERKMNIGSKSNYYQKLLKQILAGAAIFIVFFISYKFSNDKSASQTNIITTQIKSALTPAMKGINVPFEVFSFDASLGDTLFTKNGSIIIFPKHSVLNKSGKIVTGIIDIITREFNDAFDYSIAGIPMNYDSADVQYKFISSAMIDIKAYQKNELLAVNPSAKPQLNLVSTNKEKNTNLYRLDTLKGQWENKGKDEVVFVGSLPPIFGDAIFSGDKSPIIDKGSESVPSNEDDFLESNFDNDEPNIKPLPPQKASGNNPIINIEIDPLSFKELMVYNNLKFEVTDKSTAIVDDDSKTLWEDVQLQKGSEAGMYKAIFSTKSKKVSYKVKPVLEGKDFEAAERLYQNKLKEYQKVAQERKINEKEELKVLEQTARNENMIIVKDSIAVKAIMAENNKIDELNKLITIRNKYIETKYKRQDSLLDAQRRKQLALERQQRAMQLDQSLIRTFQIDGFGYWNCDTPTLPETIPYACEIMDENLNKISFTQIHFITNGINRVMTFYNSRIALVPNKKHTAWTFSNDSFYYINETAFNKIEWSKNGNVDIKMKKYSGKLNSYEDLKRVIFK